MNAEHSATTEIIEGLSGAFAVVDQRGVIEGWSAGAEELLGYSRSRALGSRIEGLLNVGESVAAELEAGIRRARESGETVVVSCELTRGGERLPVELLLRGLGDKHGHGVHVLINDLSHQQRAEEAERQLESLVDAAADAIISTDLNGRITAWNQAAQDKYGYTDEEALGQSISMLETPSRSGEIDGLLEVAAAGGIVESFEAERLTKGGGQLPVEVTASAISGPHDEVIGMMLVERDISEERALQSQLQYLADREPLTGLFNRRRFQTQLERHLAAGEHEGAIMLIDIDHFQLVNDAYGHGEGDRILRHLGRLLEAERRDGETLAHFGGDEFALLCLPGEEELCRRGERIVEGIRKQLIVGGEVGPSRHLSVSAGLITIKEGASVDEAMISADLALFAAKERGGGRCLCNAEELSSTIRQAERLERALEEERLALYAQPILHIASGKITQHELLLRIRDGDDAISPAGFLAAAERLGMIGAVDRWVIRHGIQLAAHGEKVEINLSAQSLADEQLPGYIGEQLREHRADPKHVVFEITETAAIASMDGARAFSARVQELGCEFALDDFGTGFGSFFHLKHLPVSILKIDGEFVRNLATTPVDLEIVKAIVSVARALGLETVAEWVGDEETLKLLGELGVDYAQGFLIGQPADLLVSR